MPQRKLAHHRQRVVIIGAGFGGLAAAQHLGHVPVDITLVDRHDYHTFQPLLYQVATSLLDDEDVGRPLRAMFRHQHNLAIREETATGVDWQARQVQFAEGESLPFDYLVLAAGATANYFGVPGAKEHAFALYTLPDAVRLRNQILDRFEAGDRDPSLLDDGALTFVVVGGGPTGVETAGALADMFHNVLTKDYPDLAVKRARIVLIEREQALLGGYTEHLRAYARKTLQDRGVDVRLGAAITEVGATHARLASGEELPAHTVIWAGGLHANPLADALGLPQGAGGRIAVGPDLSVEGHPEVFVAGDLAHIADHGRPLPQLAQPAIQAGTHAAHQIARRLLSESGEPFRYTNLGTMATIGRGAAVCEFPNGMALEGSVAWLAWLGVHLVELGGMRSRLDVISSWGWGLLTNERAARISIDPGEIAGSKSTPTA